MQSLRFLGGPRRYALGTTHELSVARDYQYSTWTTQNSPNSLFLRYDADTSLSQESFDRLVEDWIEAIRYSSSLDVIVNEANYLTIIGYGEKALPYIFNDLRTSPKAWFVASRRVTGENPIPKDKAGSFRDMVEAWLSWANCNGY